MNAPRPCPVPGCCGEVPKRGFICPDHYFQLPPLEARMVYRVKIAFERELDVDRKQYLGEQLQSYIRVAISHLPRQGATHVA
jgi:hypothetical protein